MKNSKFLFYEVCDVKKSFFCIEIDSFGVYFDLTDVFRLVYFWKSFIWRVSFSIYDIHLVYYI